MKLYRAYSRRNKFNAKKVESDGISFASKAEKSVYDLLCLRLKANEISHIKCQDRIYLTKARILYIADFKITNRDGSTEWAEVKGMETPIWRLKRRLWICYGPGKLTVWKVNAKGPYVFETIFNDACSDVLQSP